MTIPLQAMVIGGIALAGFSAWSGAKVQKGWDHADCDRKIQAVRNASEKLIAAGLQEIATTAAERDQAKAEVDKVNATSVAQFEALRLMLADDKVKREEASLRIEAAAKEASRNARTSAERAQAARDLMDKIADRCAGAPMPDDVKRLLDGILDPGAKGAAMVAR